MKKLIVALAAILMLGFGYGMANAAPGPNGSNEDGLCTAYFNGQKNGHDRNGQPGPFQALEDAAREYTNNDGVDNDRDGDVDEPDEDNDISAAENVFNFCNDLHEIRGNPDHGRYDCKDDGSGDSDPDCKNNPAPGNS